jgi:hypothetical protein
MTYTEKAIKTFGFENPITIAIATLEEQGQHDLAEQLFKECEELAHPYRYQDDEDDDCIDDADECGFDPLWGCYPYDC